MRYLGVPISDSRIGISGFGGLKQKMAKRPDPWRGKHLSSGGKLVLTISCLSSLPIFMMGFYLLPKSVHKWMDSLRGKFFWQGAKEEFKYHMASWDSVSRPKDKGGLGIINTKLMNECLLVKWIWKIMKGADETWFHLLKAKYMRTGDFFLAPRVWVLPNSGRGSTRLSIYSSGGLSTRWGIVLKLPSGRTFG